MSFKTRFLAIASTLAAVGAISVAATSAASAATICETEASKLPAGTVFCKSIENFEVSGSLTAKKLNQSIELKEGTFNGYAAFTSLAFFEQNVHGVIHGTVSVPPFEATIKLFGLSTKVGLSFTQEGPSEGVIESVADGTGNCANIPTAPCVKETIPTKANIGFTSITLFGLKLPLHCKTAKPASLPLEENLLLFQELLNPEVGSHFTGTTTFPPVTCNFFEEPLTALFNSALLTSLFSGPGNSYSLFVKA
jgi:hypothetical protein